MTIKRMDHVSVVVDDLPAAIAFFATLGMALVAPSSSARWPYEDGYRLCYIRGPAGIIVALAEELF